MARSIRRSFLSYSFTNKIKITFTLLKETPHVKNWWDKNCEQATMEDGSALFEDLEPTWGEIVDAVEILPYGKLFGSFHQVLLLPTLSKKLPLGTSSITKSSNITSI